MGSYLETLILELENISISNATFKYITKKMLPKLPSLTFINLVIGGTAFDKARIDRLVVALINWRGSKGIIIFFFRGLYFEEL